MLKRAPVSAVILLLVVAGFAVGVVQLFRLRLAHGDVYPPYSSLREDPLGTKVLFASLENLAGVSARRNLRPLNQTGDPRGLTFFTSPRAWTNRGTNRPGKIWRRSPRAAAGWS